jgi:DNA topoisomerase VI subunit B
MDKIDQYPEIAKEIEKDINIVSREINTVNRISRDEKQISKRKNSEVQLNVNDKDLYEDANRNRDEQKRGIAGTGETERIQAIIFNSKTQKWKILIRKIFRQDMKRRWTQHVRDFH